MEISTKTLHFIEEHREDDTRTLALQSKKYPDVDMAAAVTQIAGRQVAARKIPSWYPVSALWYPPHLSMEQCSSEATALYKASLLEGDTFADLTGGFGIDCSFISRNFKQADYVERQSGLCELALHNFPGVGAHSDTQPGRGILFAGNASGRLLDFRPCQKRRTRWKDGCHL